MTLSQSHKGQVVTDWWSTNNLSLNADKTKEMVVDFRGAQNDHQYLLCGDHQEYQVS